MVLVDLIFHHGGEWIKTPEVVYLRRQSIDELHCWKGYESDHLSYIDMVNEYTTHLGYVGVQQLLVTVPSGKYYELEGDQAIRTLLDMISDQFSIVNLYAVDECDPPIYVPSIIHHTESYTMNFTTVGTDQSCGEEDDCPVESDSPSDSESEVLEAYAAEKKKCITDTLNEYKVLHKFMTFKDIVEARKVMNLYALANGYGLELVKSDRKRVRYRCVEGCHFKCLISRDGRNAGVRIKTLDDEHTCETAYKNSRVDHNTLAEYFKNKLQGDPKFKVREMRDELHARFELNAHESKCKRAKKLILEKLEGSFTDGYKKLEAYANELRCSNPGSDVIINISKDALAEGRRKFLRMYICFHALKMGFKGGLRPFIGLDGTFLKGKATGQILVAVGQDAMNQFYPIAWAIVDKETKNTWTWFLGLLQHSLELNLGDDFTFISDMQKGLREALKDVLPNARHRFCVKHIESNWLKTRKEGLFKKYLWWSAWASYKEDFIDQLEKIGELDEDAARSLVSYPPACWARAFFDTVCKNQSVDNNHTESFNGWILEARYKPIIQMLEDIRIKVMDLLRVNEAKVSTWGVHNHSPHAMKLYGEYMKIGQKCRVVFNGDDGYEVTEGRDRHTVKMDEKKCTCRQWDLNGIPCPHAIKALLYTKINPVSEIHWWYSKEAYLLTYKLQPVRGERFWKIEPSQAMEPPQYGNMAGRPRVKRVRQKNEAILRQGGWAASRKGRVMTCSTCGEPGHNARGCDKHTKGKQAGKCKRKRARTNDEHSEDDDLPPAATIPRSPPAADIPSEEDFNCSAPEPSQASQQPSSSNFVFMPTPSVARNQPSTSSSKHIGKSKRSSQQQSIDQQSSHTFDPDFEIPEIPEIGVEADPDIRPSTLSEAKTRLQERQMAHEVAATRKIGFVGDSTGVNQPTSLHIHQRNSLGRENLQ